MGWFEEKSDAVVSLLKGDRPLFEAFWGYGVLGAIVLNFIIVIPAVVIANSITGQFFIGFVLKYILRFIIWVVLAIGVWRCANNSAASWKWISRGIYVGLFCVYWLGVFSALIIPLFNIG